MTVLITARKGLGQISERKKHVSGLRGKGSLTNAKIDTLQNYFSIALRQNVAEIDILNGTNSCEDKGDLPLNVRVFLCRTISVNEKIYHNLCRSVHKAEIKVLTECYGIVYRRPIMWILTLV